MTRFVVSVEYGYMLARLGMVVLGALARAWHQDLGSSDEGSLLDNDNIIIPSDFPVEHSTDRGVTRFVAISFPYSLPILSPARF